VPIADETVGKPRRNGTKHQACTAADEGLAAGLEVNRGTDDQHARRCRTPPANGRQDLQVLRLFGHSPG
jgi:hypothetical protein